MLLNAKKEKTKYEMGVLLVLWNMFPFLVDVI